MDYKEMDTKKSIKWGMTSNIGGEVVKRKEWKIFKTKNYQRI